MNNCDIIEREERLVVIDGDGKTHEFKRDNKNLEPVKASENVVEWVDKNTEYSIFDNLKNNVSFPIHIKTTHHLEDVVDYKAIHEYGKQLEENVGGFKYQSIEITEKWEITKNGRIKLKSVKYGGTVFKPEKA